jgi:hypothetical protein
LLYADDIILYSESDDGLQTGLNILQDYCKRSHLDVNVGKSKVMIFRKGGKQPNSSFTYNNEQLEITSLYNYLGITISSGGSFSHACQTLAGQASKALFKMKKCLSRFTNIKISHMLELFDKLILPILNYGAEIWGNINALPIERVHLKFCKEILGVKSQTQNEFIYGELGRIPMRKQRIIIMIRYWLRVLKCKDTKYTKVAYNMLLKDSQELPNKINWAIIVKNILENTGFSLVWHAQGVENNNMFMSIFKQRVVDCFQQEWMEKINMSTRANTYKLFCDFGFKTYLDSVEIRKFRVAMSKLRV